MVTGLVYTEVDGNGDHRVEVVRVKRSLARGAQSISRMRVRNSANPKTAYSSKPGHSLLRSIQQMENQVLALSVPNRPGARRGPVGGLPRAPDRTGRISVVHPGRPKGRTAVFGQDGGPYRVRDVSSGQGGWTAGDGRGR